MYHLYVILVLVLVFHACIILQLIFIYTSTEDTKPFLVASLDLAFSDIWNIKMTSWFPFL